MLVSNFRLDPVCKKNEIFCVLTKDTFHLHLMQVCKDFPNDNSSRMEVAALFLLFKIECSVDYV